MADNTKIEWTEATWNPITGCSVVSPGCTNCYAMRLAGTRMKHHHSRAGLTVESKAGPVWNGQVRLNEEWLTQPLAWKRPRMVFVCAHGDLFHESVPDEWIDRVFAVMALAPQHTFQVLTKRAARMQKYLSGWPWGRIEAECAESIDADCTDAWQRAALATRIGRIPLPNVWLGVSAEDQKRADERIPHLLATPAAVRWVSAEPLLGPVDFQRFLERCHADRDGECQAISCPQTRDCEPKKSGRHCPIDSWPELEFDVPPLLDWVVVGGESGSGARIWPGFEDAARSLRDQCRDAEVAFFMKQMQGITKQSMPPIPDDLMIRETPNA